MNSEELKKEFGLLMPSEINGFKRPDESISSSNDFFLEIPQLISKDPVLYSTMNLIFSVILSNDKLLKQWHDTLQNVVNAQDWRVVTDSLKGYMTPELKKKLDGIATGANNYVHPSNHPATMITQDATHRFVTDTEKTTWNGKASTAVVSTTANGLAPKRDGNASHFLAGDGTWKVVPSASSATSATKATQDSRGQQIDTTYIKGVTGSNATLTVTKGNGGTSTVTVNNVANATTASKVVSGTQYYLQSGNGDVDENNAISQNKANVVLGSWYSTGFRDLCTTGTPIKVAINHRTGNIKTLGNVTASGGFKGNADTATKANQDKNGKDITGYLYKTEDLTLNSNAEILTVGNISEILNSFCTKFKNIQGTASYGENSPTSIKSLNDNKAPKTSPAFSGTPTAPTQGTSDNSTKIATTAFVRNLINQFKTDGTLGGIVGGSLTQNGWVKFSNGLILQWGTYNMNSQSVSVTFPISFSSSCLNVIGVATRANDSNGKTPGYDATSISKTGFICTNGTNHLVNLNMRYLAIGK